MTTIGLRYLTGYSVAAGADSLPEWPPHPGRVFMALAAAHFEGGGDAEERAALEWLQAQPPPRVIADGEAFPRSLVETYVPANDDHGGIVKRLRNPRSFPIMRVGDQFVNLVWAADPPPTARHRLSDLCARVTRVGHSSSLVQMWLENAVPPAAGWTPTDFSPNARALRVPAPDTVAYLESAYSARTREYDALLQAMAAAKPAQKRALKAELDARFPKGAPSPTRPTLSSWQHYAHPDALDSTARAAHGPFESQIVVLRKTSGIALGLETTLQLTGALRNAAMAATTGQPPEWLSGHQADSKPSLKPHTAFFPLPFVGSVHADGHVMGLGIAIPLEVHTASHIQELRRVLGPLLFASDGQSRDLEIWSRAWRWTLTREDRNPEFLPVTLRSATWTAPSRTWASVTPVVLHHFPKPKRSGHIEEILRDAFRTAGLPEPQSIEAQPVSPFTGAGHARSLPDFTEGGACLCRYQTHVRVTFDQELRGPMLVGRGRYRGYGLFRPLHGESE